MLAQPYTTASAQHALHNHNKDYWRASQLRLCYSVECDEGLSVCLLHHQSGSWQDDARVPHCKGTVLSNCCNATQVPKGK